MRRAPIVLVLCVAMGLTVQAQSPVASASGVLLGLKTCADTDCSRFTTYWIVREGDTVQVVAQGNGLLVPRSDGFWWVGQERGTVVSDSPDSVCPPEEQLVHPPVSGTIPKPDFTPNAFWAVRVDRAAEFPSKARGAATEPSDIVGDLTLHWVGSDWISVNQSFEKTDAPIVYADDDYILPFDTLRTPLADPFDARLTLSGPEYDAAHAACRAALIRAGDEFATPEFLDSASRFWAIVRGPTSWVVREQLRFDTGAARGYGTRCQLPPALVRTQLGYDRVTVAWSDIKEVLPAAVTAFESPARDLLLVLDGDRWHAFFPRGGVLGRVQAVFRLPGEPVMAQWAVGNHVADWTRQVVATLKAGRPRFQLTR